MLILIDGCNLLHVEGVLPPEVAGVDATGLAALVAGSRYRREETILVMDGPRSGGGGRDRVRVVASGAGRSADAWIAAMVDRSTSPRSILVVSSDREVIRHARRRRCRVLDAESFLRQIGEDAVSTRSGRRGGPLPRGHARHEPIDTDGWIRAFGIAEADLDLPAAASAPPHSPATTPSASPPPPKGTPPGNPPAAHPDLEALDRFDTSDWLGPRQSPPSDASPN